MNQFSTRFSRLCLPGMIFASVFSACHGQGGGEPGPPEKDKKAEELIDNYEKFDLSLIEESVKAFLTADTVTERLKYVRDPERIKPLMMKYYGGETIKPEGFGSFRKSEIAYRDNLLTSVAETADFSKSHIAIERIAGDPVTYRVDWESWVGYCEMTVAELKKTRPVKPVLVRVLAKRSSYFNFEFEDDEKWDSYQLAFHGRMDFVSGYVRKGSEIGKTIASKVKDESNIAMILKVAYPSDARSGTSLEIVELVSLGWLVENEPEQK